MVYGRGAFRHVKFIAVTATEVIEAIRVVAVPLAQRCRWRGGTAPFVEIGQRLAQATRPQSIDKDACTIRACARVVDTTNSDGEGAIHAGQAFSAGGHRKVPLVVAFELPAAGSLCDRSFLAGVLLPAACIFA
jgi:hypothetical protein